MSTLKELMINNMIISLIGINFVNPFFRKMSGQFPNEVLTLTISESDSKEKEKKFKKIWKKRKDPFILIIRNENADLEEVLFVPSRDKLDYLTTPNKSS